jgi:hypothetical protein
VVVFWEDQMIYRITNFVINSKIACLIPEPVGMESTHKSKTRSNRRALA